ncbi:hypothetical protein Cantr_09205 [Candida viswanathii]|uniref:Uncharacterized protein n=1 Tax=Candida viswanathii TaxID=5486 RepID=A0A367Y8R3_9ASCO|nr:hypothetical protein Cantr_09205 [Candida viswanathii]
MAGIKKNRKTYKQANFRRILRSKLNSGDDSHATIKLDNCDILIYLIYMNYLNELIKEGGDSANGGAGEEGEVTEERLQNANDKLAKKYRG